GEAERRELRFEAVEHQARGRSHARASDQRFGEIGDGDLHASIAYGLCHGVTSRRSPPMPKLDLDSIPQTNATGYPPEHAAAVAGRWYRRLAPASGLSHFGASQVVLKPGAWSSQRHWHDGEDELLVMLSGEAVLVEDEG